MERKTIQPIEWLRALAVLSVVIYHFDKNLLPGGYLGVDIFLVISGYLVGGALVSRKKMGLSDFWSFIEKRFWRLQPALFFTFILTFFVGAMTSTPSELQDLPASSIMSFLGLSNLHFWGQGGYFGGASEYNLLLHTWSLSLEWQYYVFFALTCYSVLRFKGINLSFNLIFGMLLASFLLAILFSEKAPTANFYLLPSRLWEFLTGTLVFIWVQKSGIRGNERYQKIVFHVCFILCVCSLFFIDEANPMPGWLTLAPVLLTSACLACSYFSISDRLSKYTKIPFLVGRSSYSIYLVHWPLIVALGYLVHKNMFLGVLFLILILLFGYLVYRYVEQPFLTPKPIIKSSIAVLSVLIILSITLERSGGLPSRFSSNQLEILNSASLVNSDRRNCLNVVGRNDSFPLNPLCTQENGKSNILMWGDSHLEVFRSFFLADDEVNVSFLGVAGCPPIIMVDRMYGRKRCDEYAKSALNYILRNEKEFSTLIIGARFAAYVNGNTSHLGRSEGGLHQYIVDIENPKKTRINAFRSRLSETLAILSETELKVVILGGIPEFGEAIPRQIFRDSIFSEKLSSYEDISISVDYVNDRLKGIDDFIISESEKYQNFYFYDPKEILCDDLKCWASKKNQPLYFDNDHLNDIGVEIVSSSLNEFIKEKVGI